MTYILLNLIAVSFLMFFTYILDKKLIIEADDAGSFSVAILTATIETLVYTGLLAFNNAWLGSLSTPIMKIVFAFILHTAL